MIILACDIVAEVVCLGHKLAVKKLKIWMANISIKIFIDFQIKN